MRAAVHRRRAAAHGHGDATHTGVMFRPVPVASSLSSSRKHGAKEGRTAAEGETRRLPFTVFPMAVG
jgi:hypothetical protein